MGYQLRDGIEFLKSLPDKSVDGIFSDPPWGGSIKIVGNNNPMKLMKALDKEAARILKPRARVLLWVGSRQMANFIKVFKNLEYRWFIVCQYIPTRYIIRFQSQLDPILYFSLPGEPYPYPPKTLPQIYQKVSQGKKSSDHPCARPVEVVQKIIRDWFAAGEYIIDPFAGSDTTGVSCRQLQNPYDTCEVDPVMYKTGLKRNAQIYLSELLTTTERKQ